MAFATLPLLQPVKSLSPRKYCSPPRRASNHQISQRLCLSQSSALSRQIEFGFGPRPKNSERSSYGKIALPKAAGHVYEALVSESNEFKLEESADSAAVPEQPAQFISWRLLWELLSQHKLRLLLAMLALVGCSTCALLMPIYSGKLFEVFTERSPEPLLKPLSKMAALYALEPICTVIYVANMNVTWEKVMSSLRAQIFQRILIQKVGELTALLTSDLGTLNNVLSNNVSKDRGFRALSEIIGTIGILFYLSPELAPILAFLMLLVSTFVAIYKRSTVNIFKAHGLAQASIADCVNETFSSIRTVRSFNGEKRQMSVFSQQVLQYENAGIKIGFSRSINESTTRSSFYVGLVATYYLGGNRVKTGKLSLGSMASYIGYTFTLTSCVQGLVNTIGDVRGALAAIERINSILSGAKYDEALAYAIQNDIKQRKTPDPEFGIFLISESESSTKALGKPFLSTLKATTSVCKIASSGDISLEDIHFSYPSRPDIKILDGVNLILRYGTVTALVGPSGAGKSTIVQLLARFYEPSRGRITISGEDLRTFDRSEWTRAVSIVNQEPVLFSVSIGENIAYGLPNEHVSRDDVIKAAKAANAHEFIVSLPQGYDTPVGERGGTLSGGQRQRIAIARALLKNAPILILDEATSALDTVSESLVQNALKHLMKERATLVIAHRLTTVQNSDQIALCSEGKIAELGTHFELMNKNGLYASLVGNQSLSLA